MKTFFFLNVILLIPKWPHLKWAQSHIWLQCKCLKLVGDLGGVLITQESLEDPKEVSTMLGHFCVTKWIIHLTVFYFFFVHQRSFVFQYYIIILLKMPQCFGGQSPIVIYHIVTAKLEDIFDWFVDMTEESTWSAFFWLAIGWRKPSSQLALKCKRHFNIFPRNICSPPRGVTHRHWQVD